MVEKTSHLVAGLDRGKSYNWVQQIRWTNVTDGIVLFAYTKRPLQPPSALVDSGGESSIAYIPIPVLQINRSWYGDKRVVGR